LACSRGEGNPEPFGQVNPPAPRAAEQPPPQPKFEARVWDEDAGRYRSAVAVLPLAAGEKLRYEADAPTNRHLALFAIDATGTVELLVGAPPRAEPGTIGYPANHGPRA
jgi:hypothetical protein